MNKLMRELLSTGLYLLCVLVLVYLVITFLAQRTEVDGSSMEPTLSNGDSLIIDKITYRFREPERFDIVIFPPEHGQEGSFFIKRLIGMPGDTVRIDLDGTIYINGEPLQESYGKEIIEADKVGMALEEIKLENDEFFVLGDNRNNSTDSRSPIVGKVHRYDIIGRAWLRIWPLSDFGVLKHQ